MFWCNVVFNRGLSWSTRTVKNATSYWLREGFIRSQKPVKKSQKSLDRVPTNLRKSFNYENISFIYLCHFCRKHNSNIFFSCLEDFLETIHVLNVYCFLCIIKFNFLKQIHVNVYDFFLKVREYYLFWNLNSFLNITLLFYTCHKWQQYFLL